MNYRNSFLSSSANLHSSAISVPQLTIFQHFHYDFSNFMIQYGHVDMNFCDSGFSYFNINFHLSAICNFVFGVSYI